MLDVPAFLDLANQLKDVRRAGWVRCGVGDAESVADHAWAVSLLVLLLAPPHLDRQRLLALAVVHDLAETITGDITPHDRVSSADKTAHEQSAMERLSTLADRPELLALWREYNQNLTPEAGFIHELDALEMASQAISYERTGRLSSSSAEQFIASASIRIQSPQVHEQFSRLLSSRATPDTGR